MYPVSAEFLTAIAAAERQVVGKVIIDYVMPSLDPSIAVSVNEEANVSYPDQAFDENDEATYKWASLDGSWVLDGTYHLAPPTESALYQMGWWGNTLAGSGGAFSVPYPTLTMTFLSRPVRGFLVVGDSARVEYPVDFKIYLYDAGDTLLHTETVTANTLTVWTKTLSSSVNEVVKMVLEIRKWSHVGRPVKIVEFFSAIQETYEGSSLLGISLLEEREVQNGGLPVGAISANEITVNLDNSDRRFDADDTSSPLYEVLKPNRRVRAWLGAILADTSTEWVPLGTFKSVTWQAQDNTVEASVVARDRLEALRKTTYKAAVAEATTLYDLSVAVLTDAGLEATEYSVDTALQAYSVPYAWFGEISHREALRAIAEAGLAVVYVDRNNVIQVQTGAGGASSVLTIGTSDYIRLNNPNRQEDVVNEVVVYTQPLVPVSVAEEVYRSNSEVTIPAGSSVTIRVAYSSSPVMEAVASLEGAGVDTSITDADYYAWGAEVTVENTGGSDDSITLVIDGKPLTVQNQERAVSSDSASIVDNGTLRYEFPTNHLVQTLAVAQAIADAVLASAKDARSDLEIEWRGNPAIELGDKVTVKGMDYNVVRQQIDWAGALSTVTNGRRAAS